MSSKGENTKWIQTDIALTCEKAGRADVLAWDSDATNAVSSKSDDNRANGIDERNSAIIKIKE